MASSARQLRSILADLAALSAIPGRTWVDPVVRDDIPKTLDPSEGGGWEPRPRRSVFVHFPFRSLDQSIACLVYVKDTL